MAGELAPKTETSRLWWLTAGLILLLGSFFRLYQLGDQIILDDEWHALNVVQNQDYGWIFTHLGHADHSIPLALLYEFFSHTIGLSELSMRLPSLLAGILAIAALPWVWRHWLGPREGLVMAALIAVSPFLINFSRLARPYMLLALLAGCAVIFAWNWWRYRQRDFRSRGRSCGRSWGQGTAWAICTVLAAWLNPVSLAVCTAPFLWFGADAFKSIRAHRDFRPLAVLILLGLGISAVLALLLYTPLTGDFSSLAVKSGVHQVQVSTFVQALSLFAGSGQAITVALMAIAAAVGGYRLQQRDRSFALYLLVIALASTLVVALTGAEWIFQGLVLARYLIGLLPVFLALAAIGLSWFCESLSARLTLPAGKAHWCLALLLLLLLLSGPLPALYTHHSQFMHHLSRQFDYDMERNPFNAALKPVTPEPFYAEIAQLHPAGDAVVVEAPWYLESHWNPLPVYEEAHRQRVLVGFVGGTCADRLYGELRQDIEGLDFRHFVSLREVLSGEVEADYLVLRTSRMKDAREIDMDFSRCEQAARDALGEPWRETDSALVFRLSPDS